MNLPFTTLTLAAGALAVSMAPCQSGVALTVTSAIGTVGNACEKFDCLPNQTLAGLGETLRVEMFARAGSTYVLFGGMPVVGCQAITGMAGELGLWSPIVVLQIGTITGAAAVPGCLSGFAVTDFMVPLNAPLGVQFRLQMFGEPDTYDGLAFSRAVEVHTR